MSNEDWKQKQTLLGLLQDGYEVKKSQDGRWLYECTGEELKKELKIAKERLRDDT